MTNQLEQWDSRYQTNDTPWDTGAVSEELLRLIAEGWVSPGKTLELGCGTGTNAIHLARQGYAVTAVDLSPLAVRKAQERAASENVAVDFKQADLLDPPDLGGPYAFLFDRGLYHVVRGINPEAFRATVASVTEPGSHYFFLAGNANDPDPPEHGPPRVHAHEICIEWKELFDVVFLREFRFMATDQTGGVFRPLAWSCLLRRK